MYISHLLQANTHIRLITLEESIQRLAELPLSVKNNNIV